MTAQPLHVVIAAHFLLTCVVIWLCIRDRIAADVALSEARRWQALAESLVRRQRSDAAPTIVAPAWHAPRINGRGTDARAD